MNALLPELFCKIFSDFEIAELSILASVCKRWNQICEDLTQYEESDIKASFTEMMACSVGKRNYPRYCLDCKVVMIRYYLAVSELYGYHTLADKTTATFTGSILFRLRKSLSAVVINFGIEPKTILYMRNGEIICFLQYYRVGNTVSIYTPAYTMPFHYAICCILPTIYHKDEFYSEIRMSDRLSAKYTALYNAHGKRYEWLLEQNTINFIADEIFSEP